MARIEEIERITHGLQCDSCGAIFPVPNNTALDEGYFIDIKRVTETKNVMEAKDLYFCTKICLVAGITYGLGRLFRAQDKPKNKFNTQNRF